MPRAIVRSALVVLIAAFGSFSLSAEDNDKQLKILNASATGTTLTVNGVNFGAGLPMPTVNLNGAPVVVQAASPTAIIAVMPMPALQPGTYLLTVIRGKRRGDKDDDDASRFGVFNMSIGAAGPQGPAGLQGAKGDKGDKGDTGATGAAGPAGQGSSGGGLIFEKTWGDFWVADYTGWTTQPGSQATATIGGGPLLVNLNVGIRGGGSIASCRPALDGQWAGSWSSLPAFAAATLPYTEGPVYSASYNLLTSSRVYTGIPAGTYTFSIQCGTAAGYLTVNPDPGFGWSQWSVIELK